MSELYTNSRLRVFRECNRKHLYKYVLAIQTPQTHSMAFGTAAHAALEAWYRAWQFAGWMFEDGTHQIRDCSCSREVCPADRLAAALAAIDAADVDHIDTIRLRVLVVAYDQRWGDEPWEIVAVEAEFRYWLGAIEVGGKLDALVRDVNTGLVYVVEHKTSTADTSPGAPYWDRLAIDTQISIYVDGAATAFDVEIAGCVYDVLKRPLHEPKLATPEEARKYTQGKGCAKCGGSAGGKRGIVQGRGHINVVFASEVKQPECDGCKGTGWKLDDEGQPQAPRLHATQRLNDETPGEFEDRLVAEVGERIDEFLARSIVVRLDDELPRMRQEIIDTVSAMQALSGAGLAPPNHDACVRGRDFCPFFAACSGRASIDDESQFPRGEAHPELASAQTDRSEQDAA
jgi:hypothetical protein